MILCHSPLSYVSAEYTVFVNAYTVVLWNPRKAYVRDSSESHLFQVPGSEHAKLEQVVQAVSSSILTASKSGESTDSEQPVQCSAALILKMYFTDIEFLHFSLCLLPSVLSLDLLHIWRS